MQVKYVSAAIVVCSALLVASPSSFAQTSAQEGYSQPAGSVQQQLGGVGQRPDGQGHRSGATPVGVHSIGRLPFTGLDLGLVAAAGVVLLAIGLGIRRLSRSELA